MSNFLTPGRSHPRRNENPLHPFDFGWRCRTEAAPLHAWRLQSFTPALTARSAGCADAAGGGNPRDGGGLTSSVVKRLTPASSVTW